MLTYRVNKDSEKELFSYLTTILNIQETKLQLGQRQNQGKLGGEGVCGEVMRRR